MDYFKVEGGRIVDHRTIFNQMDMVGQLGALPAFDTPAGPKHTATKFDVPNT